MASWNLITVTRIAQDTGFRAIAPGKFGGVLSKKINTNYLKVTTSNAGVEGFA